MLTFFCFLADCYARVLPYLISSFVCLLFGILLLLFPCAIYSMPCSIFYVRCVFASLCFLGAHFFLSCRSFHPCSCLSRFFIRLSTLRCIALVVSPVFYLFGCAPVYLLFDVHLFILFFCLCRFYCSLSGSVNSQELFAAVDSASASVSSLFLYPFLPFLYLPCFCLVECSACRACIYRGMQLSSCFSVIDCCVSVW